MIVYGRVREKKPATRLNTEVHFMCEACEFPIYHNNFGRDMFLPT